MPHTITMTGADDPDEVADLMAQALKLVRVAKDDVLDARLGVIEARIGCLEASADVAAAERDLAQAKADHAATLHHQCHHPLAASWLWLADHLIPAQALTDWR